MNQRSFALGLIALALLTGCNEKTVEVKVPTLVEGTGEQTDVVTLGALEQLEREVANAQARGVVGEQELEKVSRLLKEVFTSLVSNDQSVTEVAELISLLPGDGLSNMLLLMNATEEIESTATLANKMDLLYSKLERSDVSVAVDQFILKYFAIKNLSIEASTDSELQASMKMVSYYRNKFESLLQDKKMSGADIFESYAMLESFVRGKAFDYIFKDLILEVKLKKTSTTQSYKTYGRILRSFLEKNLFESLFLPNENVLKSAIRYGEWSVAKLVSGSDFSATLSQIDDMNRLFDRNEKDYGNIRDNKWFDLSDERLVVLQTMQQQLKKNVGTVNARDIHLVMPRHPLTQIYLTRAYLEAANSGSIGDVVSLVGNETFESFKNNFVRKIRDNNGEISFLDEKFKESETSKDKVVNVKRQYLANTYDVIISRFFLEYSNLTNGEAVTSASSKNVKLYKNAFISLLNIVNIRNNIARDSWTTYKNLKTKQLESDLDIDHHEGTYTFEASEACGEDSLLTKTGIFIAHGNLMIPCAGKKIVFGPLSMLYAPSMDININVESIVNPWIDTSGYDGRLNALEESENLAQLPTQGSRAISRGTEYFVNAGINPQKQSNGTDGRDAGQVIYAINHMEGIPLTVSLGGNGADGADGFSVPTEMLVSSIVDGEEVLTYKPLTLNQGAQGVQTTSRQECRRALGPDNAGVVECDTIYSDVSYNNVTSIEVNLNRGEGGDGGNGGRGNMLRINAPVSSGEKYSFLLNNSLVAPGLGGKGGAAGEFGAGAADEFKGKDGSIGAGIVE